MVGEAVAVWMKGGVTGVTTVMLPLMSRHPPGTEAPGAHHPLDARVGVARVHRVRLFGGGAKKTLGAVHGADPLSGAALGRALTPLLCYPLATLVLPRGREKMGRQEREGLSPDAYQL